MYTPCFDPEANKSRVKNNPGDNKGNLNSEILIDIEETLLIFLGIKMASWLCLRKKKSPYLSEIRTETFTSAMI